MRASHVELAKALPQPIPPHPHPFYRCSCKHWNSCTSADTCAYVGQTLRVSSWRHSYAMKRVVIRNRTQGASSCYRHCRPDSYRRQDGLQRQDTRAFQLYKPSQYSEQLVGPEQEWEMISSWKAREQSAPLLTHPDLLDWA